MPGSHLQATLLTFYTWHDPAAATDKNLKRPVLTHPKPILLAPLPHAIETQQ